MIRHSDRLLAALLTLVLLWAPLPFGSVTPWAAALLAALCGGALALAALAVERQSAAARRGGASRAGARRRFALLGLAQAAPPPARPWRRRSLPEHARLEREAAAQAAEPGADAPAAPAPAPESRLTLAGAATRSAALGWAAAAAVFLAGAVAGRRREHRRWLAGAVLAVALFEVLFGARDWFARARSLWGVESCTPPPPGCAAPSSIPTISPSIWRWRSPSPSPGAGGRPGGPATSRGSSAG